VTCTLSWFEGYSDGESSIQVSSVEEFDELLDRLSARAVEIGTPFNVVIGKSGSDSLDIVLRKATSPSYSGLAGSRGSA
jgi:hypothetical protein